MMKRALAFLLCFMMVFSLAACGEEPREEEDVKETKRVPKAVMSMVINVTNPDVDGFKFNLSSGDLEAFDECVVLLKSNSVMKAVAEAYVRRDGAVPLTADYIRSLLTVELEENTNVLHVAAMCPDGKRTEEELLWLCEDLLKVVPSIIEESMSDVVDIHILDLPAIEYVTVEA